MSDLTIKLAPGQIVHENFLCVTLPNCSEMNYTEHGKEFERYIVSLVGTAQNCVRNTVPKNLLTGYVFHHRISFIWQHLVAYIHIDLFTSRYLRGLDHNGVNHSHYVNNPDFVDPVPMIKKTIERTVMTKIQGDVPPGIDWDKIDEDEDGDTVLVEVITEEIEEPDPVELEKRRIYVQKPVFKPLPFTSPSIDKEANPDVKLLLRYTEPTIEFFKEIKKADVNTIYCANFPSDIPIEVIREQVFAPFLRKGDSFSFHVCKNGNSKHQLIVNYKGKGQYLLFVVEIIKYSEITHNGQKYTLRFGPAPEGYFARCVSQSNATKEKPKSANPDKKRQSKRSNKKR